MSKKLSTLVLLLVLSVNTNSQSNVESGKTANESIFLKFNSFFIYLFLSGGIVVAVIIRYLANKFHVPIPTALFCLFAGILWGFGSIYVEGMAKAARISHHTILHIVGHAYLPIIIFTTAFCLDVHAFVKSLAQILILSIPALILSIVMIGLVMRQVVDATLSRAEGLLFATISGALYSRDVLRWLKEQNIQSKHLTILLNGETLITAAVVTCMYDILLCYLGGWAIYWYQFIMLTVKTIGLGLPMGYFFGLIGCFLMKFTYNDAVLLILLTMSMCYTTYFLSQWISNGGVIATTVAGIMMGVERTSLSSEIEETVVNVWKLMSLVANNFIFITIGERTPNLLKHDIYLKDIVTVFVTYLMTNISRFIWFIAFSPILSRLGYGMSFQNMVICIWSGLKNPICLNLVEVVFFEDDQHKARLFFLHTLSVYMLILLINGSLVPCLLRTIGLWEVSPARQATMNICMQYIYEARARTIAILKMDRFLSDANWPLVMSSTSIKHPYKKANSGEEQEGQEEDEDFFLGYKYTFCPDCEKNIPNTPTRKEIREMTKEAKLRILKLKKTTYSRQFENGMISKHGLRLLHQAVEIAMDSDERVIELDGLYHMFKKESSIYNSLLEILQTILQQRGEYKPPRKKWMFLCYRVVNSPTFFWLMHALVVSNVVFDLVCILPSQFVPFEVILPLNITIFSIYFTECILKIFACTWIHLCRHGIATYFRSLWNWLEVTIIGGAFAEIACELMTYAVQLEVFYINYAMIILLSCRAFRIFLRLKVFYFCKPLSLSVLNYLDRKVNRHKCLAYELGKNYIAGEEEILDNLHKIIDNEKIRSILKKMIENDRHAVCKRMGMAQKERPWVASTVKTKAAIRSVLNSMRDEVYELKFSGWVDDAEYTKLLMSLAERYNFINSIKYIAPSSPKLIFREVRYMGADEELIQFLYVNISTKKFDPGDVVFREGEVVDGIYILITGMFTISYVPQEDVSKRLKKMGILPAIDYMYASEYNDDMYEYFIPGNSMGELSSLTGRPYDATITAETYSEVYFLSNHIVKKAIEIDSDPVNGFECRIWKMIAFRFAVSVIINVPAYRSYTLEKINFFLERSFIPNLSNYKMFVVNEMMQDIILIEGIAIDFNTKNMFIAPCYIPRSVQKLVMPKASSFELETSVETKLMIIPAKDFDEYEIMMTEEETCEMVNNPASKCLLHMIQEKASIASKGSNKSLKMRKNLITTFMKHLRKNVLEADGDTKTKIKFASAAVKHDSSSTISKV